MIVLNCEQNSPEWHNAHIGIPTASEFNKIITTKGVTSSQRKAYIYKLAGEKIINQKTDTYCNGAMQRGIELEPEARTLFQIITDLKVKQVGMCLDDKMEYGCSPDGLVEGEEEGLEIKCPSLAVHVEYLINKKLPTTYFQQVQGSLFVTGFKRWRFFSYYPGMDALHLVVERDEIWISKFSKILKDFVDELNETYNRLKGE